jgi:hypothetical protein
MRLGLPVRPAEAVDTLLVPASGPWLKPGEAIEFARAVRPARAFPIHDAHLNDVGLETLPTTPASPWASRSISSPGDSR